jgi:ketosteroid isomerase-like protein
MTLDNEQIVRKAYQIAEDKDLKGWVAAFTDDGTFTDESIGVTFQKLTCLIIQRRRKCELR